VNDAPVSRPVVISRRDFMLSMIGGGKTAKRIPRHGCSWRAALVGEGAAGRLWHHFTLVWSREAEGSYGSRAAIETMSASRSLYLK
jgi:hypothetical protein